MPARASGRPPAGEVISSARQLFFTTGHLPPDCLPAPILRSWQRCAGLGLDGMARPRPAEPLTDHELRQVYDRNQALRRLCRPELESLHLHAKATDSVVILTDARGVVLDRLGSDAFADRAARVALMPGVAWSEAVSGTNAIGTALIEGRPIEVRGGEHFFDSHRILSCSAAPILSPTGQVVGALDLSGHSSVPHTQALGLVRLAVDQIEHRLFGDRFAGCTVLCLHSDPALIGTAREGLLVFDEGRLIAANRHGLGLLHLDWSAIGRVTAGELFATSLTGQNLAGKSLTVQGIGEIRTQSGALLHGRIEQNHTGAPVITPALARPAAAPAAAPPSALRPSPAPAPAAPPRLATPIFDQAGREALHRACRLLAADIPVLVQGETGAGKEVFARAAHDGSPRSGRPFIAVNCAALPESLIEAELFGYEAGAFTGARRQGARGLIREADGGTLFLDEIGDMPLPLQARLLRVLQDRQVMPLGGGRPVTVDCALICATHRDLKALVAAGGFRADLYFRIAQYRLTLAPLRQHPDRAALIDQLWASLGGSAAGLVLTEGCRTHLAAYDWPGNFRQLTSTLRALIALGQPGHPITPADLPDDLHSPGPAAASRRPAQADHDGVDDLGTITRAAMAAALAASKGNVSAAARRLGVSRSTLYRRLAQEERHSR